MGAVNFGPHRYCLPKCPFTEISVYRNVRLSKMSAYRKVRLPKCPVSNCPVTEMSAIQIVRPTWVYGICSQPSAILVNLSHLGIFVS